MQIEIIKHTNILTHLYLSIRLRINRFPSSLRDTTRKISPSTFLEDAVFLPRQAPPRDYNVSVRTATEKTQIAIFAEEKRESARKKEKKKIDGMNNAFSPLSNYFTTRGT